LDIALGILDGLQYLHSNHIVHGDLKPGSILLTGSNLTPKIALSGMSKMMELPLALCNTVVYGAEYRAPETVKRPGDIDEAQHTPCQTLDESKKVDIALRILDGLHYLHSNHVVHGDLKPGSILLSGSSLIPKITLLGMSKMLEANVVIAKEGTNYRAPETFEDIDQRYTIQSDIYSVSLLLNNLFTREEPFKAEGNNFELIKTLKQEDHPPDPSPNIPASLFPLISRGFSLDPDKRPLLAELRSAVIYAANKDGYAYCNADLGELGIQFRSGMIFVIFFFFFGSFLMCVIYRWNAGIY
jgi:serine/threonine protein kinase